MKRFIPMVALVVVPTAAWAENPTVETVVKKIEATFEPAMAAPGQTVTLKIKVILEDGWSTYPTMQPDAGARSQVNKITLPEPGNVIFVGTVKDPPNPMSKEEPLLGIEKLHYYPGGGVFEQKAVVSPKAAAGETMASVKFRILVCDKNNCLPPKTLELKAPLKVAGTPVPVESKYAAEVEKWLKK